MQKYGATGRRSDDIIQDANPILLLKRKLTYIKYLMILFAAGTAEKKTLRI